MVSKAGSMLLPVVAPILSINSVETQPACLDCNLTKSHHLGCVMLLVLSAIFDLLNIFFSKILHSFSTWKILYHEIENPKERGGI